MRGRRWRYQTDDARAALEAYADGVNAWLRVVQTRRARARGAGVLPLLAGHLALDAGRFDRGAEAHGAADDRQGGDGDAARAAVAGAAAGAAARHPAGFAERAADGAAAVLRALPRREGGAGRRGGAKPARPAAAAGARRRLERLRRHGAADGGGRAAPRHRPAPRPERAVDLDAGADGPRRGAGDGRRRSRGSRR